jgi:ribose transport system permease protein
MNETPVVKDRSSQTTESAFRRALEDWRQYVIYAGFVAIFIFFSLSLSEKGFLDPNNLLNIVRHLFWKGAPAGR